MCHFTRCDEGNLGMVKKANKRNQFEALHHVLEVECLPALKALSDICKEEERITKEIEKRPHTRTSFGDLITLKRALVCLLCVRITNIFKDGRGISFQDFGMNLLQNKIIKKMIVTRNTWFGHIGKDAGEIVSGREIAESDLESILKNLSALLTSRYFDN